jgi:hypothetical protein
MIAASEFSLGFGLISLILKLVGILIWYFSLVDKLAVAALYINTDRQKITMRNIQ